MALISGTKSALAETKNTRSHPNPEPDGSGLGRRRTPTRGSAHRFSLIVTVSSRGRAYLPQRPTGPTQCNGNVGVHSKNLQQGEREVPVRETTETIAC
jgi:hypothetical protein